MSFALLLCFLSFPFFPFLFFLILMTEPRTVCMRSKCSTTDVYTSTSSPPRVTQSVGEKAKIRIQVLLPSLIVFHFNSPAFVISQEAFPTQPPNITHPPCQHIRQECSFSLSSDSSLVSCQTLLLPGNTPPNLPFLP